MKIKPCKCGNKVELVKYACGDWHEFYNIIKCDKCGTIVGDEDYMTKSQCVEEWNKKVSE